jgi:hypothetical protein
MRCVVVVSLAPCLLEQAKPLKARMAAPCSDLEGLMERARLIVKMAGRASAVVCVLGRALANYVECRAWSVLT